MQSIVPHLRCACRARSYRREAPFKKEARGPRLRFSAIPMPHLRWGAGARWAQSSAFSAAASVGVSPQPAGETAAHAPIAARPLLKKKPAARICGFLQSLCHTCGGALVPGGHSLAPTEPVGETSAHAPIVAEAVPGSQPAARANTISNLLYHTCGGMTNTIFLFQPSPASYEKIPAPPRRGERG